MELNSGVRAEAVIDLDAVRHNVCLLIERAGASHPDAAVMAVVKANGYGHGSVAVALAARSAGAVALGVATPAEAVALVAAGLPATPELPVVAWLWLPSEPIAEAVSAGIELVVSSMLQLAALLQVAQLAPGGCAHIHLKIDTGLGRGGATEQDFPALVQAAVVAERAGRIRVVGLMSHLANADQPGGESVAQQLDVFTAAVRLVGESGLTPRWRHLANTAATLSCPETVFNLVRCGIGIYGISPFDRPVPDLRPAMTLRACVALTKRVPAGQGVSYGLTYRTSCETTLALVPIGYADGVPRVAAGQARVLLGGKLRPIAGRIAMDQFVVDCGDDQVAIGDEVVLFGPGTHGELTAADWGDAAGTIAYEIVTRIGERVPRRYVGERVTPCGPTDTSTPNTSAPNTSGGTR